MKCRNVQKKLSAYQDGELSSWEAGRIEAHLLKCAECRERYHELRCVWDVLGDLPDIQPTQGFYLRLHQTLFGSGEGRSFSRMRWVFQMLPSPLEMAALLLVGLLTGIYLGDVLVEEGSFKGHQPDYAQSHTSLASFRTFDTVPPGSLAHGYLMMATYQGEAQ